MVRPRSEEARQAILSSALDLLREQGFRQTTMDAIAGEAGVGKQTIYRWWKTKAEVVLDALTEHARDVQTPETGSLEGDVRAFFESTVRLLRGPRSTGPILKSLMAEAQLDAGFALRFAEFVQQRRAVLGGVLARHAPDVDVMVDMLFGALWYRLLAGHAPLDAAFTARVAQLAAAALKRD